MPIAHISTPLATTEYVDPISFDLFKDVVLKKQELYNEGRSLVQQTLDTTSQIEGMLANDADKEYFRQEMKKYVDAVNKNAGLDFSHKGNVQAVLNIGRPLENDQILSTAIKSSQNKKRMLEERQKMDPKLVSPANDAIFFDPIINYSQSTTPGTSLEYTPYIPYSNEISETLPKIIDKLKPTITEEYSYDPSGRYLVKRKYTELDAARIKNALMGSLSPAGQKQLLIDAQYDLKVKGKEGILPDYSNYLATQAKSSALRVGDAKANYQKAVETFGKNDPRTQEAFSRLNQYEVAHDVYVSKATRNPQDIPQDELVNFLVDQNLSDATGSYAYKNVESDMDADKYSLAEFNSTLRRNEKIFEKDLDLATASPEEQPAPPGMFKADSSWENKTHGIQKFTDLYGGMELAKQKELIAGMYRYIGGAEPVLDEKGNVVAGESGKTTIYDALRNWNNSNGWSETDRTVAATALGGSQKYYQIRQKMKGLYNTLTNASTEIQYKENGVPMQFNPKSSNVYFRDMNNNVAEMPVQKFLTLPATVLVQMKDIRISKPFEGDYQVK
jgi:hypothetical protein